MTEEEMRAVADEADEWSVSCRRCGAPTFHDCMRDPSDTSGEAHRQRITDAVVAAIARVGGPGAA